MDNQILWIGGALVLNSLLGLAGILFLWVKEKELGKIGCLLMSFAAGTLLAGAFFHLLPESFEYFPHETAISYALIGFLVFLVLETFFHCHHCTKCDIHPFTYLMLLGDGVHNLIDGLIVAASFIVSIPLGIVTTLVIMGHEIPQELGLFGVLIHGGVNRKKALVYSLIAQSTCILGGIVGYLLSSSAVAFSSFFLPFAAGGFIYIASSDLIPELHRCEGTDRLVKFSIFFAGLIFMFAVKSFAGA